MASRSATFALLGVAAGFYLPGVAVREYSDGERVEIKVNKLSSTKTQLPYDYYSLPFCKPAEIVNKIENLGEVLRGDRIMNSHYDLKARRRGHRARALPTLGAAAHPPRRARRLRWAWKRRARSCAGRS